LKIGNKIPAETASFRFDDGFRGSGRLGWWGVQSDANPSPCCLANIRVIFDKNREPVAKNVRKACGTATLRISDYFNIREEQGAWLPGITDQQVSELRTARAH
jgi:hypothetical protein